PPPSDRLSSPRLWRQFTRDRPVHHQAAGGRRQGSARPPRHRARSCGVLLSGALDVVLEQPDRDDSATALQAGRAFVVPRGIWHRLFPELFDLLLRATWRTAPRGRAPALGGEKRKGTFAESQNGKRHRAFRRA